MKKIVKKAIKVYIQNQGSYPKPGEKIGWFQHVLSILETDGRKFTVKVGNKYHGGETLVRININ